MKIRQFPEKESILVVDDALNTVEIIKRNLESQGYKVFTALNVDDAVKILDSTYINLVITDIKMPAVSGHDLIRHVRENFCDTEVIVITGYPSIQGAVEAVKTGAEEYLAKPFTDNELVFAARRALDKLLMRKNMRSQLQKNKSAPFGIVGNSEAIHKVFQFIEKAAATSATVLITGESGTGKELVARAIHYISSRAGAPFVPINCGGIPESLLESELFGYVKGAFTGAFESRAGFFQTADGGTIFLDEISETSTAMQIKLLRVLQDKEVCMIASRRPQKVDVRILAATNKDLSELVTKGRFREDLFYRINVISINIPPLRERDQDILILARHFSEKFSQEYNKTFCQFTQNALSVLQSYYWPGNVRELENLIQSLVVMKEGTIIDTPDLPSLMRFSAMRENGFNRSLAQVESDYINNVLTMVNGNKTKAARILGITRKTLRDRLKKEISGPKQHNL